MPDTPHPADGLPPLACVFENRPPASLVELVYAELVYLVHAGKV